ncbi:MAG TPA: hypothetical protein VEW28_07380 [Candidatus Kapabacteria bacterium]|nr:hypothetical protein [Candidatus Kapabacteria bacterium]
MNAFPAALCLILLTLTASLSQQKKQPAPPSASQLPQASVSEKKLYTFDLARTIKLFDATPTGNLWFAADEFGLVKTIVINGVRNDNRFSDISSFSTRISPNGKYLIWMGLVHTYDENSFNTTTTIVFRHNAGKASSDSVGAFESDNPKVFFSSTGDHWAALLPASNALQTGLRDIALLDGNVASSGFPHPSMFTFFRHDSSWAYRSSDGRDENIITASGKQLLYKRSSDDPFIASDEPTVYRFSPDIHFDEYTLDGRDFDAGLAHTASLYKTTYLSSEADSAKQYLVFDQKRQLVSRWIKDIQITHTGDHISYFAADTAKHAVGTHALVVHDGSVVGGPYDAGWRLFMSPSGKHLAWTAATGGIINLYVDGALIGTVGEYFQIEWSRDENHYAYATNDDRDKIFVVAGKKRSASFDSIGRLAIAADGSSVQYCAIKYDALLHIQQRF